MGADERGEYRAPSPPFCVCARSPTYLLPLLTAARSTPSQAHAEKRDNDLQNLLVQAEEDNAERLEGEAVMIEPVDGCVERGGADAALVLHPLPCCGYARPASLLRCYYHCYYRYYHFFYH